VLPAEKWCQMQGSYRTVVAVIPEAQQADPGIAAIKNLPANPAISNRWEPRKYARAAGRYILKDGVEYAARLPTTNISMEGVRMVPFVPKQLRQEVVGMFHNDPRESAHLGEMKTLKRIQDHFYWPEMTNTVKGHVKNCQACQLTKRSRLKLGKQKKFAAPFIGPLVIDGCEHDDVYRLRSMDGKLLKGRYVNVERIFPYHTGDVPVEPLRTRDLMPDDARRATARPAPSRRRPAPSRRKPIPEEDDSSDDGDSASTVTPHEPPVGRHEEPSVEPQVEQENIGEPEQQPEVQAPTTEVEYEQDVSDEQDQPPEATAEPEISPNAEADPTTPTEPELSHPTPLIQCHQADIRHESATQRTALSTECCRSLVAGQVGASWRKE